MRKTSSIAVGPLFGKYKLMCFFVKGPAGCQLYISKMYFTHRQTAGVSKRIWSLNIDTSNSREYETRGGHSGRPSEYLRSLLTGTAV
jgi:hypothetical protein